MSGHRYYSPEVGRWINRDPIGERGCLHLYAFLNNNGLNWVDGLGLDPVGEWISDIYWYDWLWKWEVFNDDQTETRDDGAGNTMADRTALQMDIYYGDLAADEELADVWTEYSLPVGDTGRAWWVFRRGGFSDAGFWLNQAHRVEVVGGTYEARACGEGKIELRKTKGEFRWFDRIDNNPSRNDPFFMWLGEIINIIPETITGADFDVEIDWQDDRDEERPVE